MSPEDLLVLIAQDLRSEEHTSGGLGNYVTPLFSLAVCPDERAKRVMTDVASEWLSSFAVYEDVVL